MTRNYGNCIQNTNNTEGIKWMLSETCIVQKKNDKDQALVSRKTC